MNDTHSIVKLNVTSFDCLEVPGVGPGHPCFDPDNPDPVTEESALLLHTYPTTYKWINGDRVVDCMGGDVDTIQWPNPDQAHLRSALFDVREQGYLPADAKLVELPNGTLFPF